MTASAKSWYSDPAMWAALGQMGSQYIASTNIPKGDLGFKPQPESPEERALRIYAERMAGVPDAAGTVRPGAMPTLSYIGPQIDAILRNQQNTSAGYKPLDYLDMGTGKPVPSAPTPARATVNFDQLRTPWSAGGGGVGTPSPTGAQTGGPPQPPRPIALGTREAYDAYIADQRANPPRDRMSGNPGGRQPTLLPNDEGLFAPSVYNPGTAGMGGGSGTPASFREVASRVDAAWDSFRAAYPGTAGLTQQAITALAGTLGLPVALVARYVFGRMNAPEQTPGGAAANGPANPAIPTTPYVP